MEDARYYYQGGFHPIHTGDQFKRGQYIVVHKLGHGRFSTVWLAEDLNTQTYVALKVLAADVAGWSGNLNGVSEEIQVFSRLRDGVEEPGKECVVRFLDHFVHHGPNGEHHCIVTELLGPCLSSDIEELYPTEIFPAAISRAIIRQIADAVRFLHRNHIVHGDLHLGNILLTSPKLSSLSHDDITLYYGEVAKCAVNYGVDGIGEPPHAPQYIVDTPDPTPLLKLCLRNPADVRIKVCDFSESSVITASTRPKTINMPYIYRAPEVVLKKPSAPAFSAEIWALAVLFHCVSTGRRPVFQAGGLPQSEDELLKNIVLQLGKLPEPLWSAWDKRTEYFDEKGRSLDKSTKDTHSLRYRNTLICEEERVLFERMIQAMLVLEPEKRVTINDVVKSEWFVKYLQGPSTMQERACMCYPSRKGGDSTGTAS
ncbi:hypothetical protein D9619_004391 [Psilocybe cf. subviscida]|uniref:non-specific serine/threonine protein kinase n=1 Tax=Psilocybe cf. subviscida TaxID=2480587 RepID=A0A8H5BPX5_9AGAR|nr:hypothetical protein D9619_004391 [Psilocybe cf. subviscida]